MSTYHEIINQINKKYNTNYQITNSIGEGNFVKVFDLKGYKESPTDTSEYVGRFTLRSDSDDMWEWVKKKTRQEYALLTRKDIQDKYVGKLCKTYEDEDKDPEWFFSIQKKLIPIREYQKKTLGKKPSNEKKELIYSKIFSELSEALRYVHSLDCENSKGVLLRDVKPENIMYDKDVDRCVLCDFNTAREFNINNYWAGTTITAGTVAFMAPEIYLIKDGTERYPNPRQDVYSLGATIFTLTTRKFTKYETNENSYGQQAEEISDEEKIKALEKTGLSKEFRNIIFCSIQRVPEKRYQDANELYTYTSMLYRLRKAEHDMQKMSTDITMYQTQISSLQTKRNTLQSQYDEISSLLYKERTQHKKEIEELKEKITSLTQIKGALQEKIKRLEINLVTANRKVEKAAQEAQKNTRVLDKKELSDYIFKYVDSHDKKSKDNRTLTEKEIDDFLSMFEDPAEYEFEYDKGKNALVADIETYKEKPEKKTAEVKVTPAKPPEKEEKPVVNPAICSVGLTINSVFLLGYMLLKYFGLYENLTLNNRIPLLPTFLLLVPYYFLEIFALANQTKPFGIFLRSFIVSGVFIRLHMIQDNLLPNTLMTMGVLHDILWTVAIIFISHYYIQQLVNAKKPTFFRTIIILAGAMFLFFEITGFLPQRGFPPLGTSITFGSYEQDNNEDNGVEPIKWTVSGYTSNSVLLTSDKCLEYLPYNGTDKENLSWQDSDIRKWLNNTFIDVAFSDDEQKYINKTYLPTAKSENGLFFEYGQEYTEDYIFMDNLSYAVFFRENPEVSAFAQDKYENSEYRTEDPQVWTRSSSALKEENKTYIWVVQTETKKHIKKMLDCTSKAYIRPSLYLNLDVCRLYKE